MMFASLARPVLLLPLLAVMLVACNSTTYKPLPPRGAYADPMSGWAEVTGGRAVYTVQRGDTLYGISRKYGVPLKKLIETNGLSPPYALRVGQSLILSRPPTHVVRKGDTLYGISRHYGVNMNELARFNGLRAPYTLQVGQRLRVPEGAGTQTASVQTSATSGNKSSASSSSGSTSKSVTSSRSSPTTPKSTSPAPAARPPGRFIWPVSGKVIAGFGTVGKGLHNDGVNIAVTPGTPVRAAEAGTVAYAGNELRGFGNLLLIRHSGGWVTAYAHNSELLVKRGDKVTQGEVISKAGSSGGVTEPQVHFEIRQGSTPVDPTKYLPKPQS